MNKNSLNYFKRLLSAQLQNVLSGSDCNLDGLKAPDEQQADLLDQAAHAIERNFSHHLCSRTCDEEIPIKRLKVKPMARYCINCQTKIENKQQLTDA
jgi:RNA polymerase-binding transcription factor DksA